MVYIILHRDMPLHAAHCTACSVLSVVLYGVMLHCTVPDRILPDHIFVMHTISYQTIFVMHTVSYQTVSYQTIFVMHTVSYQTILGYGRLWRGPRFLKEAEEVGRGKGVYTHVCM